MHPGQGPGEQEAERAGMMRRKARELAFQKDARVRLAMSCKHPPHRDRIFHPGQWVYVYRKNPRAAAADGHPLRQQSGAWRGPGLVLLQTGHTVWIAMRSRLWRCNSDQVRNAAAAETLGTEMVNAGQFRELMSHIRTSHGASALDVSKEGSPPHGSEPDEVQPEGAVQIESRSLDHANAMPIPSEPPEVVIMPSPGGLPSISEEQELGGEPEPPPSAMESASESGMRSTQEPAHCIHPQALLRVLHRGVLGRACQAIRDSLVCVSSRGFLSV
eukprot:6476494-Amphidinium_carterae.1